METFSGSQLKAGIFTGLMAQQEPCALTIGHSGTLRLYVLPAQSWSKQIDLLYGEAARKNQGRHISHRDIRNEAILGDILMNQVDAEHKPYEFAVVRSGDMDAAYIVPANPYWREKVEGGQ